MRRGVVTYGTVLILLAVLLCCGCTGEPAEGGNELAKTVWMLETYMNAADVMTDALDAAPVTAEFAGNLVGGSSGCNTYSAGYSADGSSLSVGMPVVTMMYCIREGVMEQESQYLALLQRAAVYTISGDRLTISDAYGQNILVFLAVGQNLVGTEWLLTGYNNGAGGFVSVFPETTVTAKFSDGGLVSGNAGCNSYSGAYSVAGSAISIGPLAMTEMYCPEPEGLMGQEIAYLAAIEASDSYRVGPGDLILYKDERQQMAVFERYDRTPAGMKWKVAS